MVIVWLGSSDAASVLAFDGLKSNGWAGLLSDDPSTIMEGNKKLKFTGSNPTSRILEEALDHTGVFNG